MFGTHDYVIFLLAGIALNLAPGQDTIYILSRSIAQGRVVGIASVFGVGAGCTIHVIAAAVGLYSVIALSPAVFFLITLAGALYLIYLGIITWTRRTVPNPESLLHDTSGGVWLAYRQGMTTNLLNPKVAMFFISFLPQFIDPVSNLGFISFLFLGGTFLCTGMIWCLFLALCASAVADTLRTNPRIQTGFDGITSLIFICLGVVILIFHGGVLPA